MVFGSGRPDRGRHCNYQKKHGPHKVAKANSPPARRSFCGGGVAAQIKTRLFLNEKIIKEKKTFISLYRINF